MKRRKRKPMHEVAIELVEAFTGRMLRESRKRRPDDQAVCAMSGKLQGVLEVLTRGKIPHKHMPSVVRRLHAAADKLLHSKRAVQMHCVPTNITLLRMSVRAIEDDRWDVV